MVQVTVKAIMSKRNMKRFKKIKSKNRNKDSDDQLVVDNYRSESSLHYRGLFVPDHFFTHHVYVEKGQTLLFTAATGQFTYLGNSAFEVNHSTLTGTPVGVSQIANLYNRVRIHSSAIKIQLVDFTEGFQICVVPSLLQGTPNSLLSAMQQPYAKYLAVYNGVGYELHLVNHISTKEIFGIDSITQDDTFSAPLNGNPANPWYWQVLGESHDGTTTGTVRINVTIEYYFEWYERTILS